MKTLTRNLIVASILTVAGTSAMAQKPLSLPAAMKDVAAKESLDSLFNIPEAIGADLTVHEKAPQAIMEFRLNGDKSKAGGIDLTSPPKIETNLAPEDFPPAPSSYGEDMQLPPEIPSSEVDKLKTSSLTGQYSKEIPPPVPPARLKSQAANAEEEQPKNGIFLSRSQIAANRKGCDVTSSGTLDSEAPPGGSELSFTYNLSPKADCLSGAAPNVSWIEVVDASPSKVTITIEPNVSDKSRVGEIAVVTKNGKSLIFKVNQFGLKLTQLKQGDS